MVDKIRVLEDLANKELYLVYPKSLDKEVKEFLEELAIKHIEDC